MSKQNRTDRAELSKLASKCNSGGVLFDILHVKTLATSPHVKIFSYHEYLLSEAAVFSVLHWGFEASWWQLVWTSPTNPSIIQTLALSFKCFWVHWSWGTDILLLDLHQNLDLIPPSYPLVNCSPSIRFTYIEHFNILIVFIGWGKILWPVFLITLFKVFSWIGCR